MLAASLRYDCYISGNGRLRLLPGLGSKQRLTDAVNVRLQQRSLNFLDQLCAAALLQVSCVSATQRISCDFFLTSFLSLLARQLLWPHPRQSLPTRQRAYQRAALTKNNYQQGSLDRLAAAKNSVPEARQGVSAAASRTRYWLLKSLAGCLHARLRARQTAGATVAMELQADKTCRDFFFRRIDRLVIRESFIPSEIPSPSRSSQSRQ